MTVAADIRDDTVEVAIKDNRGNLSTRVMSLSQFSRKYGRTAFLLAVPLRSISAHTHTADTELPPEELLLMAEAQTKQPLVLTLRAGDKQTVYHFLGTPPPPYPRARPAPRFLAYWAELGMFSDGILVYSEGGEHLAALIQGGYWRTLRVTFSSAEAASSLLTEVERLIRFAQTQGQVPPIYVPEPVAMDYAHLAEKGYQVEVYIPQEMGALGLLRLPEEYFFRHATSQKPSTLSTPSHLGTFLLALGLILAAAGGGQYLYLKIRQSMLTPAYQEALTLEAQYHSLKTRVDRAEQVLQPWTAYQQAHQTPQALDLIDSLVSLSAQDGIGLKALSLDASTEKVLLGTLQAQSKNFPVSYLESLRTPEGRTVSLRAYTRAGVLHVEVRAVHTR